MAIPMFFSGGGWGRGWQI